MPQKQTLPGGAIHCFCTLPPPHDWKNPTLYEKKNRSMELRMTSDYNKGVNSLPIETSKKRPKKEFSAWAEYMDEEKDEDFIRWKKEMVGECQEHRSTGSMEEKPNTKKENRRY
ncbi:hypothetical protein LTS07_009987 [Exophiala sideris]|uniref:Uncharacterized protein n=1 Tax=Exophiala sideris TaxID=1016849 RepID=A0ABR0IYX1_9EURO|nr:hypothetical protein LTS07_009987 [Exophiala sideris]KAK5028069.1 hypothetical protein LTR13_009298 [Exophiala sideris]KAK5051810.1 hypothetical protein LTR69_010101 [Exophiala sideris]